MGRPKDPRVWSERRFKLALNLYPPFLFGRTRVVRIGRDFRSCTVRVKPSFLTRNLQGSIFGGTIFSAADPFHALLYWQVFAHRGLRVQAWLKSARIEYRRPASSDLTFEFALSEEDIEEAQAALDRDGRFAKIFRTEAIDRGGQVCSVIHTEVYLRRPREEQRDTSGF
jgi:acyl-coenzyme A thioesterase PaaI-like protein